MFRLKPTLLSLSQKQSYCVIFVALSVLMLAACGGAESEESTSAPSATQSLPAPDTSAPAPDSSIGQAPEIVGYGFEQFKPVTTNLDIRRMAETLPGNYLFVKVHDSNNTAYLMTVTTVREPFSATINVPLTTDKLWVIVDDETSAPRISQEISL